MRLARNRQPAEARLVLLDHIRKHGANDKLYKLLAEAAGAAGYSAEGHRYLAEHYFLSGETERAIKQLELALRQPQLSFYEKSQLQARLEEFSAAFREESKRK